jgi:hypothetical protein
VRTAAKTDSHEQDHNIYSCRRSQTPKNKESKQVREWTPAERREAFCEARKIEFERAEAGIVEEWELCQDCHESKCERGI